MTYRNNVLNRKPNLNFCTCEDCSSYKQRIIIYTREPLRAWKHGNEWQMDVCRNYPPQCCCMQFCFRIYAELSYLRLYQDKWGYCGTQIHIIYRTRSWFDPRHRQRIFPLNLCVHTGSGVHPASCQMSTGGPFPGGKARPGHNAGHSPPSSAEVMNE
jgi:hypothetical protein